MSPNIMVTGAAGQYGSIAIDLIKKFNPDVKLFGLVHSPNKADSVKAKGVEVRIGDFSDKASLVKAFKDIDRLLFVSVSVPNIQKNVVEAAKECGISFIAYTSIAGINYSKIGLETIHHQTEQWIIESGIPHTFLRNNWYLDLDSGLLFAAKNSGKFHYITKEGKVSYALRREYAEVGARVILREKNPEIINLTRTAVTYPELGKAVEEALGKKIEISEISKEKFETYINESNASDMNKILSIKMQEYVKNGNNGEEFSDPTEFEEALGHPLEPLSNIIKEFLSQNPK